MLSEDEKKLLKIFKAQVEKEETEYFSVNAYTQLLYDSHRMVLNLITKLQKENEDLLREKEENKFIIAMANNEMLGYNQGYSDAENKNSNATEIVIKNRQAYIHKEEVELYKRKIDFLQKENEEKDKQIDYIIDFIRERSIYAVDTHEKLKQYFADLVEKE